MNGEQQVIVALATAVFNGGALIAFWVWARSAIIKTAEASAATKARCVAIEQRCTERMEWLAGLTKAVNVTARNVVKLAESQGVDGLESPD